MFNELLKNVMALGIITKDDVKRLTSIELMLLIIERVNGLLESLSGYVESNDAQIASLKSELAKIRKEIDEKLDDTVIEQLNEWMVDGTLEELINQTALQKINNRVDDLYPMALHKARVNTSNRLYSQPVVTFIDDDGTTNFLTITKPLFDEYGIIASIAVIPAKVGTQSYMSEEQLMELQKQGYSMLSHSYTHDENIFKPAVVDSNGVSDDAILNDYKQCYKWMVERGFNGADTIVFPWGGFTDSGRYKNLARTYYNNGVNASGDGCNEDLNDNMYLNRRFINKNVPLSTYQAIIDDTVKKGGWLILGSHSNYNEIDQTHLRQIIEYIKEKNIAILPFIEANELKGNAINIGDFTVESKFFVSRRGTHTLTYDVSKDVGTCTGLNGFTAKSTIKQNNKVVNILLTLTGTAVTLTNQLQIADIRDVPKLPQTIIVPCVITTSGNNVIGGACVLNAGTTYISVSCHGAVSETVKRVDIMATYITE